VFDREAGDGASIVLPLLHGVEGVDEVVGVWEAFRSCFAVLCRGPHGRDFDRRFISS
jgi:hypothetical protein